MWIECYLVLVGEVGVFLVVVFIKIDLFDSFEDFVVVVCVIELGLVVEIVNGFDFVDVVKLVVWCGWGKIVVFLGFLGVGKLILVNMLWGLDSIVM